MGCINEAEKPEDFDSVLLKAVDEGLRVLGESAGRTVYYYLEKEHGLRREDIPKNPETFDIGLKTIFSSGASIIERHILERLHARLGLTYKDKEGWSFIDYIKEAKQTTPTQSLKPSSQDTRENTSIDLPSEISFKTKTLHNADIRLSATLSFQGSDP